jgi:hypothetical protein
MDMNYLNALTTDASYSFEAKRAFHTAARTLLLRLTKELDGYYGGRDPIRSNQGGMAVSGEITLHYNHLYVQISQSCLGDNRIVLFRSCDSRKDYTGHQNHFATALELCDSKALAARIRSVCPTLPRQ